MESTKYLLLTLLVLGTLSQVYDPSTNVRSLQAKVLAYKDDLAKLNKQVQRIKRDLSEASTTSLKISTLQEAQANERDLLISINSYLNLPFNYTQCECVVMNDQQRTQVNQQVTNIRKGFKALSDDISLQQRCPKMNAVRSELTRQLGYLDTIQEILNAQCCQTVQKKVESPLKKEPQNPSGFADISTHIIQTNLKSGRWIYGCLSKHEVRLRYFDRTVNTNVTNCPDEKPYFNGVSCVSCPSDQPIWDLCDEKCTSCSYGSQYDQTQRKCITSSFAAKPTKEWQNVVVAPINQGNEIVPPIVGPSTITIVTKNRTKVVRKSTEGVSRPQTSHLYQRVL